MALQVALSAETSGIGTPIQAAYARIVAIQYSVQDGKLLFAIEYHWDQAARHAPLRPIGGQTFSIDSFDFAAEVGIKAALYTYLKTLPIFAGAVDV